MAPRTTALPTAVPHTPLPAPLSVVYTLLAVMDIRSTGSTREAEAEAVSTVAAAAVAIPIERGM
jgi:hypothetical protein